MWHFLRATRWRPSAWPISIKVPAVVAVLLIGVGALVTDQLLRRVEIGQEKHLRELASAYLDGLSATVMPHVLRQDTWEIFDALDRAGHGYRGLEVLWTTVALPDGTILASSNPGLFKVDSRLPDPVSRRFGEGVSLVMAEADGQAHLGRTLVNQGRVIGGIYADVSIRRLVQERSDLLISMVMTNMFVTIVLAGVGYIAVRWMMRPMKTLTYYLGRGKSGSPELIPDRLALDSSSEFGRLFGAYNRMAQAVNERELMAVRLAEEEKLGSLGRLISAIAHEINNPLGGLFNALDALKRHGEKEQVRATSVSLLERGLQGIRDVVRSALHIYRLDSSRRRLSGSDFDDVKLLIQPEITRRRQLLVWQSDITSEVGLPAAALRDMILNLLLNACGATPEHGTVRFRAEIRDDRLIIAVKDDGVGMPDHIKCYLERAKAGSAPIEDRAGLGLWMVRRLADEVGGEVRVDVEPKRGTVISLSIPLQAAEVRQDVA
jgi:signal transduction histidine kinase